MLSQSGSKVSKVANITNIDGDFTRMFTNFTLINGSGQANRSTVNKALPRLDEEVKEGSEGEVGY